MRPHIELEALSQIHHIGVIWVPPNGSERFSGNPCRVPPNGSERFRRFLLLRTIPNYFELFQKNPKE